jgi:hypothetical protein
MSGLAWLALLLAVLGAALAVVALVLALVGQAQA